MAKPQNKYPEVKKIQKDLESLKDNTVELANHVKEDSVHQVEETAGTIKSQAQREMKKAEAYVKQNPLQSVALAFAGGLAASILLRR